MLCVYNPELNEIGKDVPLDPNHTHFILVDDGKNGEFGAEIDFRANLENELNKGKKLQNYTNPSMVITATTDHIPMILIVVQGGPNTLKTVYESIKNNTPVLILAVCLIDPTSSLPIVWN